MKWIELKGIDQVEEIKKISHEKPVLIFKHSSRCNVSRMALDRLERQWNDSEAGMLSTFFLDLLTYRDVSNEVARAFGVEHQSPQVIVIVNGKSALDLSHFEIDYNEIRGLLQHS